MRIRRRLVGAALIAGISGTVLATAPAPAANNRAPVFQFDPTWPVTMPNHWIFGSVIGVAVDSRDHVWVVHRSAGGAGAPTEFQRAAALNPPTGECCVPAPPVVEFDQQGRLVQAWGGKGPGFEWPDSEHGIFVDHQDHVWIGSNGGRSNDSRETHLDTHVLKFTRDGKFVVQIGHQDHSRGNADTENMYNPAAIAVDAGSNEVFVADGENNGTTTGNRRVIVFDANTGQFTRMWGAYGNKPDDTDIGRYNPDAPPPQQFRGPHGIRISQDGLVYVADRTNDRVQVFHKDGTFVKEKVVAPRTLRAGSVSDIAFSPDAAQTYLYIADGMNKKVWVLLRDTLEILDRFGDGGHQGGQFDVLHNIAVDRHGNLYLTETLEGKRIQRFLYKGTKPVPANLPK